MTELSSSNSTDRAPASGHTDGAVPRHAKLLLVGAMPELEQAVERRGRRAVVFTHADAEPRAANGVVERVELIDFARPIETLLRIADLHVEGDIGAVVAWSEFGLLPAALATEQRRLPGPSLRAVWNTRDKLRMRQVLEQAGLAQIAYAACNDLGSARAFLEAVGGPIIVKPVAGTGSDGVSRVVDPQELPGAFKTASAAAGFMGVLCEEYIEGPEVSLEAFSVGGRFVPVALTDKLVDDRFLETGHEQPSRQSPQVLAAVTQVAERALAALGVTDGVTHSEFRLGPRGPALIETHTRMGGDLLHVLTRLTTGVDLADLMVAVALGEPIEVRPAPTGRAAAVRFLVGRAGQVAGVDAPSASSHAGIHAVKLPKPGRKVTGRSASRERLGYVLATGATVDEASQAAAAYSAQVQIRYE